MKVYIQVFEIFCSLCVFFTRYIQDMGDSQFEQRPGFETRSEVPEIEPRSDFVSIEVLYEAVIVTPAERTVWKSEAVYLFLIVFVHFQMNLVLFIYFKQLIPISAVF